MEKLVDFKEERVRVPTARAGGRGLVDSEPYSHLHHSLIQTIIIAFMIFGVYCSEISYGLWLKWWNLVLFGFWLIYWFVCGLIIVLCICLDFRIEICHRGISYFTSRRRIGLKNYCPEVGDFWIFNHVTPTFFIHHLPLARTILTHLKVGN